MRKITRTPFSPPPPVAICSHDAGGMRMKIESLGGLDNALLDI